MDTVALIVESAWRYRGLSLALSAVSWAINSYLIARYGLPLADLAASGWLEIATWVWVARLLGW